MGSLGDTKVCERCRRVFRYPGFGHYYCEECKAQDQKEYEIIRDYLSMNGVKNMVQISTDTGVDIKYIKQYLRDGRLEIPTGSEVFIQCELCHTEIRSGRYCPECAANMTKELKGVLNQYQVGERAKQVKVIGKMHFLGSDGHHKKNK